MEQNEILSHAHELPKIPKVIREMMELVNDPDVELQDLSKTISLEQVVSGRVLRLANSAHFSRGKSVSSVNQAVVRLGLEPLKTLIIASSLVSAFPYVEVIDLESFWQETFEVAVLSKAIGESCSVNPNDAFTAGMLHNIGDLMIYTVMADKVPEIFEKMEAGDSKVNAQRSTINTDSAVLGAKLAESWSFSKELVFAISEQYEPKVDNIYSPLAATVRLANAINREWDKLETRDAKKVWLSEQIEVDILFVNENVIEHIDEVRGSGVEMARLVV
ncbi:HDOD domain-containing protein [Aliivibrio fischeri]|uniref:HDOD domain-containing protein n=1 Tax=Aliivibrio fischeri TaxID=668 RepID=UPI0012D92B33|nr:HDOD domain-containing protein [Aliivibrio fischeri]MUK61508.1 HDOD domain-containing protein [Aliivibrio fischeri]MUK78846.1 HDOD domain-containing protein [Aliivibrio fischeri]MUL22221.1 HDOD domain-containing protein [Aliivibrio fischeri]MUL25564.1 HDOD domain-containing protein [Aliivibrio fischeri]